MLTQPLLTLEMSSTGEHRYPHNFSTFPYIRIVNFLNNIIGQVSLTTPRDTERVIKCWAFISQNREKHRVWCRSDMEGDLPDASHHLVQTHGQEETKNCWWATSCKHRQGDKLLILNMGKEFSYTHLVPQIVVPWPTPTWTVLPL